MATISASPESVAGSLRGTVTLPASRPSWYRPRPERAAGAGATVSPDEADTRTAKRLLAAGIVVFMLALGLSGLMASAGSHIAAVLPAHASTAAAAESAAMPAWTVSAGDTLWSIARATDPEADPRVTVGRLREVNGLSDEHVLQVGEVLQVPSR
ncbi:MAG: LysM peptidoglycan-binding domain-containing protein [Candidatus Nanopelagicales bacterium]